MALPATAVWEVRPTVGSDTNGGGFDPAASGAGTDYSQQNAKNTSGNNKSTTDVVATGVATITSATASFTSAIVGNIIYLSGSGITTGWYEVVTYTNGTTVILDRSPGTGTGATMNIGGALLTIAQAATNAAASNLIWIKNTGTYTATSAIGLSQQSGGSASPAPGYLGFFGYNSSRGDGGQVTWTTSTNSINLVEFSGGQGYFFQNIEFTNTAGTPGAALFVGNNQGNIWNVSVNNCSFNGFGVAVSALNYGNTNCLPQFVMRFCSVTNCTGTAGVINGAGGTFVACYFGSNTGHGVQAGGTSIAGTTALFVRCVFYNNGGDGVEFVSDDAIAGVFINCASVSNTGDGIGIANSLANPGMTLFVQNTVLYGNGGFGINNGVNPATFGVFFQGQTNAFGSNTSGNYSNFTADPSDIALTADPFTNPSSGNFTLNSTSGGGLSCQGAGFPSTLP